MIPPPLDAPSAPDALSHPAPRRSAPEAIPLALRRRNQRWLFLLLLTPVVMTVLAVLAVTTKGPPEPSVPPRSTPVGYRAISDAYFGYAVPAGWGLNAAYSDGNGDFFYGGAGGWVGETIRIRPSAPIPGVDIPAQLSAFGQAHPSAVKLGAARPIDVPGVAVAYQYEVTRADGLRATAVEVWQRSSQTQAWLLVAADQPTSEAIVASFRG